VFVEFVHLALRFPLNFTKQEDVIYEDQHRNLMSVVYTYATTILPNAFDQRLEAQIKQQR
jgi:hypothetical protein